MTVRENILFLENFSDISINSEKYHEMLAFFEMKTFENSVMKSLSVGQRERVNLIRACVHSPQIVILDEPGSNLDERLFDRVFSFLEREKQSQKNAIILATHHPKFRELATTTLTLEPLHNA